MSDLNRAAKAYAEFLTALDVDKGFSEKALEDSSFHVAELMMSWMRGLNQNSPEISLMPAYNNHLVSLQNLPFYSFCAHHFVPFFGTVRIDYVPETWITGLGEFSKVIEHFSRQPQFQEKLCSQIAEHLFEALKPRVIRVQIRARQMCLELNGKGNGIEVETETVLGDSDLIS